MFHRFPINPMIITVFLWVAATGCPVTPGPESSSSDSATLNVREWRLVLLVFDRNHDTDHLNADIQEFQEAAIGAGSAHRIVVRDSHITEGTITFVDGDTLQTITDPNLRTCDLTTAVGLRTLLEYVTEHFPASREALLLTGHGRDWTGFGLRSDAPEETLTSTAAAAALSRREEPPQEQVVLADGSWTATGEWTTSFSGLNLHMVTAAGEVIPEGLDYRVTLTPEALENADALATRLAESLTTEPEHAGIALNPEELQNLPGLVQTIATAGTHQIQSALSQQQLKQNLLSQGVAVGTPGMSWISVESVITAVGLTPSELSTPALHRMLLYLTEMDIHGVPTGHRSDYCSNAASSQLCPEFQALGWAPDHQHRSGFLYHLWYQQY